MLESPFRLVDTDVARAKADQLFARIREQLLYELPNASEILHIGATSIPGCFTKGDLDIVVRVAEEDFETADLLIAAKFARNEGSVRTNAFSAFADAECDPHLGIQLVVVDSPLDFFHNFAISLRQSPALVAEYNALKLQFDGADMSEYRSAKDVFVGDVLARRTGKPLIRLLSAKDSITELTALLHLAYAQLGAMGFNYTAVDQSERVTRERIANGECYVAVNSRGLLGTILFHATEHTRGCPWYDRPEVSAVHQFGVLPGLQRRGIGRSLLAAAERRAAETGATELALDTSEGASHLIDWYARLGYRHVGYAQWSGKTYRSVVMSKKISALVVADQTDVIG